MVCKIDKNSKTEPKKLEDYQPGASRDVVFRSLGKMVAARPSPKPKKKPLAPA
jgi:hypothetical protein